eukprot:scaffold272704_cov21-Tisochrysis_lutea.AAC.3
MLRATLFPYLVLRASLFPNQFCRELPCSLRGVDLLFCIRPTIGLSDLRLPGWFWRCTCFLHNTSVPPQGKACLVLNGPQEYVMERGDLMINNSIMESKGVMPPTHASLCRWESLCTARVPCQRWRRCAGKRVVYTGIALVSFTSSIGSRKKRVTFMRALPAHKGSLAQARMRL